MLIQKEELQNQNNDNNPDNEINHEEINNNLDEINSNTNQAQNQNQNNNQNNNQRRARGFDIFLSHGLNAEEVRALRVIFHFAQAHESLMSGVPLDWTNNGIYTREERWLINQLNLMNMNNRNRNEENNNYISLNVNDDLIFSERNGFNIFYENQVDLRYVFIIGFLVGILTNVFGIILLFCRFKATFKLGLICGIIISVIFFSKILHFK